MLTGSVASFAFEGGSDKTRKHGCSCSIGTLHTGQLNCLQSKGNVRSKCYNGLATSLAATTIQTCFLDDLCEWGWSSESGSSSGSHPSLKQNRKNL